MPGSVHRLRQWAQITSQASLATRSGMLSILPSAVPMFLIASLRLPWILLLYFITSKIAHARLERCAGPIAAEKHLLVKTDGLLRGSAGQRSRMSLKRVEAVMFQFSDIKRGIAASKIHH